MEQLERKIGIIAGKGILPRTLINSLLERNIKPCVLALSNIAEKDVVDGVENYQWSRIAAAGKIIDFFKDNEVRQIVLAGGLKRPSFASLIPDAAGLKLL